MPALVLSDVTHPGVTRAATPLTLVRVAENLSFPLYVTAPPGDTARVFIIEQHGPDNRGRIKILKNGSLLPTPFLTTEPLAPDLEQGLLGLAFAPDYATSGRFYINYTEASAGTTILERRTVSADPDVADTTGTVLLSVPQPYTNHNGGWLGFGPDGYLYMALGDGGSAGDPFDSSQNLNALLGKILRLDVSGTGYTIPPDNPYAGAAPGLDEIWASGLRNPWRNSFDRDTGDFIVTDVGQGTKEEVNFAPAASPGGENYGWRCWEGTIGYAGSFTNPCQSCSDPACPMVFPAHQYDHITGGCSVIGGYVYRGITIPDLRGTYFFGDWCTGQVWSGTFQGGALTGVVDRTAELAPGGGLTLNYITSFGEDARGDIYICDWDGEVYKIVPDGPTGVGGPPPAPPRADLRILSAMPLRSEVQLEIELPREERVSLDVFDGAGRRVRALARGILPAGRTEARWDGRLDRGAMAPAGVYFVGLRGEGWAVTRRVVLVR